MSSWLWKEEPALDIHHNHVLTQSWLIYFRALCSAFHIFLFCWNIQILDRFYKPIYFLTDWGYIACGIFFILSVGEYLFASQLHKKTGDVSASKPLEYLSRIAIIFFQVGFSVQLTIILLFWAVVYPAEKSNPHFTLSVFTMCTHGVVFVLIYIEFMWNKIRFYVRHTLFLVIFMGSYAFANFIVTKSTGEPIYGALTWKDVDSVVFTAAALLIALFHYIFGWIVFIKFKAPKRHKERSLDSLYEQLQAQSNHQHPS
eukprot:TRINITY_DN12851_c0_g1_i1.p1 TRINITY_DN12851_c0_g1~~TRINITY_DN12851_c0_g1_i1.p1  ORF type:complete len:257 (-),score=29.12 TRINITY_DN12851_c0_g1_i1:339-1109(-)